MRRCGTTLSLSLFRPDRREDVTVTIPPSPQLRGYLRLHATMTSGTTVVERKLRLASIPDYTLTDSRFGMNHAFGWPEMLTLCKRAGLVWMRDWSMKWQDVEPSQGQFTFDETDAQVGRLFRQDFNVLEVLPFPSTMWSSSAPESVRQNDPWYLTRSNAPDSETQYDDILAEKGSRIGRFGYPPRDMKEFQNYVSRTVDRYKDRIHYWQVFNEPLLTGYALPRRLGYTAADYLRYVETYAEAARRSDPNCKILGGFNLENKPEALSVPLQFIGLGGQKHLDVFTLHAYPARRPPEYQEQLLQEAGRRDGRARRPQAHLVHGVRLLRRRRPLGHAHGRVAPVRPARSFRRPTKCGSAPSAWPTAWKKSSFTPARARRSTTATCGRCSCVTAASLSRTTRRRP